MTACSHLLFPTSDHVLHCSIVLVQLFYLRGFPVASDNACVQLAPGMRKNEWTLQQDGIRRSQVAAIYTPHEGGYFWTV